MEWIARFTQRGAWQSSLLDANLKILENKGILCYNQVSPVHIGLWQCRVDGDSRPLGAPQNVRGCHLQNIYDNNRKHA